MAEIAKQIGIFIMALIIVGIPFISGRLDDTYNEDDYILKTIFIIGSAIDMVIVCILINHCI